MNTFQPGQRSNEIVALYLGWKDRKYASDYCWEDPQGGPHLRVPEFTTDIKEAIRAADTFMAWELEKQSEGAYRATLYINESHTVGGYSVTAALAICEAIREAGLRT